MQQTEKSSQYHCVFGPASYAAGFASKGNLKSHITSSSTSEWALLCKGQKISVTPSTMTTVAQVAALEKAQLGGSRNVEHS